MAPLARGAPGASLLEPELKQLRSLFLAEERTRDAAWVHRPSLAVGAVGVLLDRDVGGRRQCLPAQSGDRTAPRDFGREVNPASALSPHRLQSQVEDAHTRIAIPMRLVPGGLKLGEWSPSADGH